MHTQSQASVVLRDVGVHETDLPGLATDLHEILTGLVVVAALGTIFLSAKFRARSRNCFCSSLRPKSIVAFSP
jgi:hypothetical protein